MLAAVSSSNTTVNAPESVAVTSRVMLASVKMPLAPAALAAANCSSPFAAESALNAGDPNVEPEFRFVRTLDEPRHVIVANVNGDAALDLIVACEGQTSCGNSISIIFGNPNIPGSFYEEGIGPTQPISLPGYEGEGEVEGLEPEPGEDRPRLWRLQVLQERARLGGPRGGEHRGRVDDARGFAGRDLEGNADAP